MIAQPIQFIVDGPDMQKQLKEGGLMAVTVPRDPDLITVQNVLVAVIYSAETGEEYNNYKQHPKKDV